MACSSLLSRMVADGVAYDGACNIGSSDWSREPGLKSVFGSVTVFLEVLCTISRSIGMTYHANLGCNRAKSVGGNDTNSMTRLSLFHLTFADVESSSEKRKLMSSGSSSSLMTVCKRSNVSFDDVCLRLLFDLPNLPDFSVARVRNALETDMALSGMPMGLFSIVFAV